MIDVLLLSFACRASNTCDASDTTRQHTGSDVCNSRGKDAKHIKDRIVKVSAYVDDFRLIGTFISFPSEVRADFQPFVADNMQAWIPAICSSCNQLLRDIADKPWRQQVCGSFAEIGRVPVASNQHIPSARPCKLTWHQYRGTECLPASSSCYIVLYFVLLIWVHTCCCNDQPSSPRTGLLAGQ